MEALEVAVDEVASATGFSGVVRVDQGGRPVLAKAYGLAHRGLAVPNAVDTRFGIASGTSGVRGSSFTLASRAARAREPVSPSRNPSR